MVCPTWNLSSVDDMLMLDYAFHQHNMYTYLAPLLNAQKPIFINQWQVAHKVLANASVGGYDYIRDVMSLAQELGIGWCWWNIAGSKLVGGSTAPIIHYANGTTRVMQGLVDALVPYFDQAGGPQNSDENRGLILGDRYQASAGFGSIEDGCEVDDSAAASHFDSAEQESC